MQEETICEIMASGSDLTNFQYPLPYKYEGVQMSGRTFPKSILDRVSLLQFEPGDLLMASYPKTGMWTKIQLLHSGVFVISINLCYSSNACFFPNPFNYKLNECCQTSLLGKPTFATGVLDRILRLALARLFESTTSVRNKHMNRKCI